MCLQAVGVQKGRGQVVSGGQTYLRDLLEDTAAVQLGLDVDGRLLGCVDLLLDGVDIVLGVDELGLEVALGGVQCGLGLGHGVIDGVLGEALLACGKADVEAGGRGGIVARYGNRPGLDGGDGATHLDSALALVDADVYGGRVAEHQRVAGEGRARRVHDSADGSAAAKVEPDVDETEEAFWNWKRRPEERGLVDAHG